MQQLAWHQCHQRWKQHLPHACELQTRGSALLQHVRMLVPGEAVFGGFAKCALKRSLSLLGCSSYSLVQCLAGSCGITIGPWGPCAGADRDPRGTLLAAAHFLLMVSWARGDSSFRRKMYGAYQLVQTHAKEHNPFVNKANIPNNNIFQ